MKRKTTKQTLAVMLVAAIILLAATSCQIITTADSTGGGNVVISRDPIYQSEDITATAETAKSTAESTAATTASQTTSELAPTSPLYINPLTKTGAAVDPSGLRPMAVVVDNNVNALPHQTGLCDADILCETLTAPGITRFLALYSDYRAAGEICNIRAARVHDVKIAAGFNAFLVCHGGHADTTEEYDFFSAVKKAYGSANGYIDTMEESAWNARNGEKLGTIRYYDNYRTDLRYDTVITPEAIELTENGGSAFRQSGASIKGECRTPFVFSDSAAAGDDATEATLTFTASGVSSNLEKAVTFKYDGESGKYMRYEGSRPHVDSKSGEQLGFTNVVVLMTDVKYIAGDSDVDPLTTDVAVYGSGTGYCLSGGKCTAIIWVNTEKSGLRLYTADSSLMLAPGSTYVGYLDKANAGALKITE